MRKNVFKTLGECLGECRASLKRNWRRSDVCVSIWCAFSFVGLGTCFVIVSPTMLDLAAYIGVGLSEIAAMLMVRSVGSIFGSVSSGILFDKFYKISLWMLIIVIISGGLLTIVLPLTQKLPLFGIAMFIQGALLSSLDTGVHAFLIKLWKDKDSGPVFQLIHATFAVGAFFAPLIARPFISSIEETSTNTNRTCSDYNGTDYCLGELGQDNCTSSEVSGSLFHSVTSDCVPADYSTSFIYAYWFASVPLLLSVPPLLIFAIKSQCCCKKDKGIGSPERTTDNDADQQLKTYPDTMLYKTVVMILLFFLILLYVGAEVAYGTYIFAFAVKGDLQFSKKTATILSSVFWGTFAFFRSFTITLSLCKVSPSIMLAGNLIGSLTASLIVTLLHSNETAVWIGSALMGASFASLYPNIVVWLTRHGPASGKTSSILAAGATIGDTTLPVLVGVLIDKVGPVTLCYYTLANIICCCSIFTSLFIIARRCKVKNYYKLKDELKVAENNTDSNGSLLMEFNSKEEEVEENNFILNTNVMPPFEVEDQL